MFKTGGRVHYFLIIIIISQFFVKYTIFTYFICLIFEVLCTKMMPMSICVNGKAFNLQETKTLRDFIAANIKDKKNIVAELNGHIIKEPRWNETPLQDGDSLELVTLYGGG